ncbi:hypothetical protein BDM02DRAFT_3124963 [Thelephora ganbajun]|uniref:Uncharacterized protein n=1 Tax=Thelephora ganbajun TaxID=370292 RepID=A0ACB6YXF9_THEGA|nr:hypothetical protein BDM02DRAFT_3124963 [Thelephora ganbajun]
MALTVPEQLFLDQYGVAKSVHAIAVKVLGDNGSDQDSDIISGIDRVTREAKKSGKPTVASNSVDNAVRALYVAGVTITVAAGNESQDASNTSPAHVREAITCAERELGLARIGRSF